MRIGKIFLSLGLISALGACGPYKSFTEINNLNAAEPVGSPFTKQLTEEYKVFSNFLLNDVFDYSDSIHFARKGLVTADGEVTMPEPVNDWDLTIPQIETLSAARARLLNAFDLGAREQLPNLTAVAQSRFDCWVESAEEDQLKGATGAGLPCQSQFFDALNQLESSLVRRTPEAPVVAAPEAPVFPEPVQPIQGGDEPVALTDAIYLVFFDFDSSKLGTTGVDVVQSVANEINNRSLNSVTITGHADSSGSKAYNANLSKKRTKAVRDALVQRGVPAGIINTLSKGENELLVPTPDNVKEAANRRATITFE